MSRHYIVKKPEGLFFGQCKIIIFNAIAAAAADDAAEVFGTALAIVNEKENDQ